VHFRRWITAASAMIAAAANGSTLSVNLASDTGPFMGSASGALYGLSQNGVPGSDLLGPLHIQTIAQDRRTAPQHPLLGRRTRSESCAASGSLLPSARSTSGRASGGPSTAAASRVVVCGNAAGRAPRPLIARGV
jgi:hypothetical protein